MTPACIMTPENDSEGHKIISFTQKSSTPTPRSPELLEYNILHQRKEVVVSEEAIR